MRVVLAPLALFALTGCLAERTYLDPSVQDEGGWFEDGSGQALLLGDVGDLTNIDSRADDMWVAHEPRVVAFSGNVPHQARSGSSVYLDVRIVNGEQLAVGQELRQSGLVDSYEADAVDGPALDVYVCPNGEGISGNADDIVVVREGPSAFRFQATSSNTAQNLNVDLQLIDRSAR